MQANRNSSSDEAEMFEDTNAEASLSTPAGVNTLRKGSHVIINNRATKVTELARAKNGKHGHAKVKVVATDIFSGARREMIFTSGHNCMVPNVSKAEYLVLYANEDGYMSLMDDAGTLRSDLQLPENEVAEAVRRSLAENEEGDNSVVVSVLSAMGENQVVAVKTVVGDW